MKKYISLYIIFIVLISLCIGCNNHNEEQYINEFNSEEAKNISDKYLNLLCEEKIQESNSLLSNELKESFPNTLGDTGIVSYKIDEIVESIDSTAIVYDIIRVKSDSVRADRDTMTIKVKKDGDDYRIFDIKSSNKNQVYSEGDNLRFMGEEGGDSQLILDIDNLHIDVYPKNQKVMIEKAKIPHNKFDTVSISYTGKKVALTTTNDTDFFIASIDIDEGVVTQGQGSEGDSKNTKENSKSQASEKSIAKKIIPLDILKVTSIDKLVYSLDEEKLIVQYVKDGKNRVNIYNTNGGDLVDIKLDSQYPIETYSINFLELENKLVKIKVVGNNEEKIYKVDLETNEIKEE